MSKPYTSCIESELRKGNLKKIAKLLYQFGKYKGYPIQQIERKLEERVKELKALGHNYTVIAQMIEWEWLKSGRV